MKAFPNYKAYHDLIKLYLDVDDDFSALGNGKAHLFQNSNDFFFELVHRSIDGIVSINGYSGIGDIKDIGMDIIEDFNVNHVAAAGQLINKIRKADDYRSYSDISRKVSPFMKQINYNEDYFIMQALQEGAALTLLDMYPVKEVMRMYWDYKEENDWKSMRCALWRYLMYSGFIQVDKNHEIIKESIPNMNLLPRLTERFIDIFGLKNEYQMQKEMSSSMPPLTELLDAEKIARNFLRFNKVEVKDLEPVASN